MKKTLSIALAGMMLLAFTQCDNAPKNGSSEEEISQGSKVYNKAKKLLTSWDKAIKEAKNCEDLDIAYNSYTSAAKEIDETELSEKENEKVQKRKSEVESNWNAKKEVLCKEEGSEAFKMTQSILSGLELDIDLATTCDDIEDAMESFERRAKNIKEGDLEEGEMENLRKQSTDIVNKALIKQEELCKEEGSEAYRMAQDILSELEFDLNVATTCEELEAASDRFIDKASEIDDDSFTEEEKEKLEKRVQNLLEKVEAKANELCNNGFEDNPSYNGGNSNGSDVISTINMLFNDYERALDNARTCEDIQKATDDFEKAMSALESKYSDYDLSESEEKEIEKLSERIISKSIEKTMQLCK